MLKCSKIFILNKFSTLIDLLQVQYIRLVTDPGSSAKTAFKTSTGTGPKTFVLTDSKGK